MRFKTLLGATLGIAAGMLLQTAAAAPEKGAMHESCTATQLAVIDAAYQLAEVRIAEAIVFLDTQPEHPHVLHHFGDAPRKQVRLSLTLTQATLPAGQRAAPRCGDPACGTAFGMADKRTNRITFCPNFFTAGTEGRDARYGVVIHESSHIAATTRDAAYFADGVAQLARLHSALTPMNAESLEHFVEFLPR